MTSTVVYYSNTNQSKQIAQYFATKLGYPIYDIFEIKERIFDNLIFAFPVYCQGLPDEAKRFLAKIKVRHLTLLATYGKMCHGNALYEIQSNFPHNIVAAAYIPTKHSYLSESEFNRFCELDCIVDKILEPSNVRIPKSYKNPFANILKNQRARLGVKLYRNENCDGCGICTQVCKNNAIVKGTPNNHCIRCLKCVDNCPTKALRFDLRLPMRNYLKKKKKDDLIIYI